MTHRRMRKMFAWLMMAFALTAFGATGLQAQVLIQDGFDDLDRDNDGTTDDGNGTAVGANDGIRWYEIDTGITTEVQDDSAAGGIGSGAALFIDVTSNSREIQGVFDEPISLGAGVGSTLTYSFDARFPSVSTNDGSELRFGLFDAISDTFNNPDEGNQWGSGDGNFDALLSPNGPRSIPNNDSFNDPDADQADIGHFARIRIGTGADAGVTDLSEQIAARGIASGRSGGVVGDAFESDSLQDHVIDVDNDLDESGNAVPGTFVAIADTTSRRITVELERVEANSIGANIQYTLTISDGVNTDSISGIDRPGVNHANNVAMRDDPNNPGGPQVPGATLTGVDPDLGIPILADQNSVGNPDTFEYFVAFTTRPDDWFFDNFTLEVNAVGGGPDPAGDFNGDGVVNAADFVVFRDGAAPDGASLDDFLATFGEGNPQGVAAANAVPEPAAAALLLIGLAPLARRRR